VSETEKKGEKGKEWFDVGRPVKWESKMNRIVWPDTGKKRNGTREREGHAGGAVLAADHDVPRKKKRGEKRKGGTSDNPKALR